MKTSLYALALLIGVGVHAADAPAPRAQRASVATGAAKAPAATPAAAQPVDITYLVTKDSAVKDDGSKPKGDAVNRRGVNCSLYPARCP